MTATARHKHKLPIRRDGEDDMLKTCGMYLKKIDSARLKHIFLDIASYLRYSAYSFLYFL